MRSEKSNFELDDTFRFPYTTFRARIDRESYNGDGTKSPLSDIEPKLVSLISCMSNIKRSLTVTEGLMLVNDIIKGTNAQQKLIKWKTDRKIFHLDEENIGEVGVNYWKGFLKRHKHLLKGKTISQYAIDRSNFTTYLNFFDMYQHIERVLLLSKIARKFEEPVWMNQNGEIVENDTDAYGYKVTIDIHRPDLGIVLDECGCNLSQEGDGHIGGEKFLTGLEDKAYSSTSTKHNHFTVIRVTQLDGNPLMCVVIVSGKKHDVLVELGVDVSQLVDLDIDYSGGNILDTNIELLRNHSGEGRLFSGLPTCHYKGKDVPGYMAFTEKGGINASILTNIFRRMDNLKLFDDERADGLTPFVLLDGHSSRFDVEFLEYVNDVDHKWNVCLGVPYGTALWQVADSAQQNGKFKMLLNRAKRELFIQRMDSCQQDMHLVRTDIVPLVRKSWEGSFCDVMANRRAISERGWGPYNRNLLLHPVIRASMTEDMINNEKNMNIFPHNRLPHLLQFEYRDEGNGMVKMVQGKSCDHSDFKINLDGGATSRRVSSTIMSDYDRQKARERVQKMKDEGTTIRERLGKLKNT